MELVNFKAGNIPASTFAIPSDYKKIEMANLAAAEGQEGAAGADSAAGKKDNKAEAAKKKLKSIFKH